MADRRLLIGTFAGAEFGPAQFTILIFVTLTEVTRDLRITRNVPTSQVAFVTFVETVEGHAAAPARVADTGTTPTHSVAIGDTGTGGIQGG